MALRRAFIIVLLVLLSARSAVAATQWLPGPMGHGMPIVGLIETPADGKPVPTNENVTISGWAVDPTTANDTGIDEVHVYSELAGRGKPLATGKIGLSRWDVAATMNNPAWERSGFVATFPATRLGVGSHLLEVHLRTRARGWWYSTVVVNITTPPCILPNGALRQNPWGLDHDGVARFSGVVTNTCTVPIDVEINQFVLDAAGQPLAVAPSDYLARIEPGARVEYGTFIAGLSGRTDQHQAFNWYVYHVTSDLPLCLDVGARSCLVMDPWLQGAVRQLATTPAGPGLLQAAAEWGVVLQRGTVPYGYLALYRPATRTVVVSLMLDRHSPWERAASLAHELRHAADHASGFDMINNTGECYQSEFNAARTQAEVWKSFWREKLPEPQSSVQTHLNRVALILDHDPDAFQAVIEDKYKHQCE